MRSLLSQFIDIVVPAAQIVSEARVAIIFGNLLTGNEEFRRKLSIIFRPSEILKTAEHMLLAQPVQFSPWRWKQYITSWGRNQPDFILTKYQLSQIILKWRFSLLLFIIMGLVLVGFETPQHLAIRAGLCVRLNGLTFHWVNQTNPDWNSVFLSAPT